MLKNFLLIEALLGLQVVGFRRLVVTGRNVLCTVKGMLYAEEGNNINK